MNHNQTRLTKAIVLLLMVSTTDAVLAQKAIANETNEQVKEINNQHDPKGKVFFERLIKPGHFDYQFILSELGFSDHRLLKTLNGKYEEDYDLHLYFSNLQGKLTGQDVNVFKEYITRIIYRLGFTGESCDSSHAIGELTAAAQIIYVETYAPDCAYGTIERPFSSIAQARDSIRTLKQTELNGKAIDVIIGQGNYSIDQGLTFTEQDSGYKDAAITYRAEDNGAVNLLGGIVLNPAEFTTANGDFLNQLVNTESSSQILEIDLTQAGIENLGQALGELTNHGWNLEPKDRIPSAMLYSGNKKMDLARWPNIDEQSPFLDQHSQADEITGMVSYSSVVDKGLTQQDANKFSEEFNNGGGVMAVEFDRPSSWNKLSEVHLDGILAYSWEWTYNQVKAFDPASRQLTLKRGELSGIGSNKGSHFYFENIAEELDQPGEFYIDRALGKLYFYPTDNFATSTTVLSTLAQPMVSISGAKYLSFDGLNFDSGRNLAVKVNKSQHIEITNCSIRNFSLGGVLLDGSDNSVSGCEITNVGGYGVKVAGGTAAKLSKSSGSSVLDILQQPVAIIGANNIITENTIYNFAWDQKSQIPGISLTGVGNLATYNEIHTAPHFGILMRNTTDNIVAYNYVHDLPNYHKNDGGALYVGIGAMPHLRGNEITNNYFEHIPTNGVYLDNFSSGIKVANNVFNDVGNNGDTFSGININGGGQNVMEQNFFYNAGRPIKYNKFAANSLFNNYYGKMKGVQTAFNNADVNSTPYVKYPDFIEFLAYSTEDEFHYQSSSAFKNFSFNNLVISDERAAVTGVVEPDDKRWALENNALVEALNEGMQPEFDVIAAIFSVGNDKEHWRNTVENVTSQLSTSIPLMLTHVEVPEEPVVLSNYSDETSWNNNSGHDYWTGFNLAGAMLDVMRLPASDNKGGENASNEQVQAWLAGDTNTSNDDGFKWRYASKGEMEAIASFFNQDSDAFLTFNQTWSPKGGMWAALTPTTVVGDCTHNDGCLFPAYAFTVKATSFSGVSYKQSFGVGTTGGAALLVRERISLDDDDSSTGKQNFIVNGDLESGSVEPWNIEQGGASLVLEQMNNNVVGLIQNRQGSHASTVKQSFTGLVQEERYNLDAQFKMIESGYDVGVFLGYRNEGAKKDITLQIGEYQRTNGEWLLLSAEFTVPVDALTDKDFRIWIRSTKGENATSDPIPNIYFDNVMVSALTSNPEPEPEPEPEPTTEEFVVNGDFENATTAPWDIVQGGALVTLLNESDNHFALISNRTTKHTATVKQSISGLTAGEIYLTRGKIKLVEQGYEVAVFVGYRTVDGTKDISIQVGDYVTSNGQWLNISNEFTLPVEADTSKGVRIWIRTTKGIHTDTDPVPNIMFDDISITQAVETVNIAVNGDLESGIAGYTNTNALFEVLQDVETGSHVGHVYDRTKVSGSARLNLNLSASTHYTISVDAKLVDNNLAEVVGDLDLILLYFVDGQRTSVELDTKELAEGWITLLGEITMPEGVDISGGKVWVKSDHESLFSILFDNLIVATEVVDTTNPDPDPDTDPEPEPEIGTADGEIEGYGIADVQCQADFSNIKADALYVAAGSESGDGSEAAPFASLTLALASVAVDGVINQPGLTIYLREGEYHDSVDSSIVTELMGSVENPVIIKAFPCETVRFTGVTNIENIAVIDELGQKSLWQQHYGNIYKREITAPVWQLFVDDEQHMLARWPNANFDLPSVTNHQSIYSDDVWAEGVFDSDKSQNGIMTNNPAYHNLAAALDYRGEALNVDGAIVLANTASFYTYSRLVKAYDQMLPTFQDLFKSSPDDTSVGHVAGSNSFTHEPIKSGYKGKQLSYYVEAKLELLDASNEWHYQVEDGKHFVYLWNDSGAEPTGTVTVRDTGYAFDVANWENVEISGLDYFASTIKCSPCNNITIADSNFKHSATSLRVLKQYGDDKSGYGRNQLIELYSALDKRANSGIVFKNNVVTDSDVQSLIIQGGQSVIENNLFERLDATSADTISPHATVMITKMTNQQATFSGNTMDIIGNSTMFVPEGGSLHALYNNMITGGFAQNDGASFQLRKAQQAAANIAYNWAHDSEKYGIRFDAPFDTTDETSGGQFGLIHHNVVWNAKGIMVKGDDHRVYHNTTWNNADIDLRMLVDPNPYYKHERTVTSNNASDSISSDRSVESDSLAGVVGNNFNGLKESVTLVSQLRDMFNYDFRPSRTGALHDSGAVIDSPNGYAAYTGDAPLPQYQESVAQGESLDLGAYELDSAFYWIPGYKTAKASFAIPRNELVDGAARTVGTDVSLIWRDGYQSLSHHLYLASSKNEIEATIVGDTDSTLFQGDFAAGEANVYQPVNTFAPGSYYWRVDAVQVDGTVVQGDTWKFIVQ